MDLKVAMMLKKSKFVPGMVLGKNQQEIAQFPDFKNQMHTHGLYYLLKQAQKANNQTENGVFIFPGGKKIYMKKYEKTISWEIFDDVTKRSKRFKEG